jgi:hypothetical protein
MYLSGSHLQLRRSGRRSDPRRIILLLALILGGVVLLGLNVRGDVKPVGEPTPAPTLFLMPRRPKRYSRPGS